MQRIYLDNNSTTALDPRIFEAMLSELKGPPANPSSVHFFGTRAKKLLSSARATCASYFSAKPEEIIFTSGGTESINTMLRGLPRGHLIASDLDHSAVYKTMQSLEAEGFSVKFLSPKLWGAPIPEQVEAAIRSDTRAIVLGASNTETGVKTDLESISALAERHQIPLLVDAVSVFGKEFFPLYPGISAVACSGHKFHAPKGVGLLFLRTSFRLKSVTTGGSQEYLHRAGTENLAGIVGLAEAFSILRESQDAITQHLLDLRCHFECELLRALPDLAINGLGPRICNTVNIAFAGCDGESLLLQMDMAGIAASLGSACSTGALEPSRILTNMGLDRKTARSSIRFSFGKWNTREEVDLALEKIVSIVKKLRSL